MEIAKNAGITYKQTPVANGTLVKVIKAAMASHLEDEKGWNYYVSKSKEAIAELAESGENAAEVKDAPAVIVPVYAPAKEAPTAEDVERSRDHRKHAGTHGRNRSGRHLGERDV